MNQRVIHTGTFLIVFICLLFFAEGIVRAGEIWHRDNNEKQAYTSGQQLVGILIRRYPDRRLDVAAERKQNPGNPYEDGIVYAITNSFGHTPAPHARRRNLFDSKSLIIEPGFRIYATLDDAVNSAEFRSMYKRHGHNDTIIQEFTIDGRFLNLYDGRKNILN